MSAYDFSTSLAEGVQALALSAIVQQGKEASEQERISSAKASSRGRLFLPTIFNDGEDEILEIELNQDIIIYAVHGLYRISTNSDYQTKNLFILRYFHSYSKELDCHVLRLSDELNCLFPDGWKVNGRLMNGQVCYFSSDNIDEIKRQEEKLQIEKCIAKIEQQIQERIKEITISEPLQKEKDHWTASSVILAASSLIFLGLAFTMNQAWWAWLLFTLIILGSIACGIYAFIKSKDERPYDENVERAKDIANDSKIIAMKADLAKYQEELKQYKDASK